MKKNYRPANGVIDWICLCWSDGHDLWQKNCTFLYCIVNRTFLSPTSSHFISSDLIALMYYVE